MDLALTKTQPFLKKHAKKFLIAFVATASIVGLSFDKPVNAQSTAVADLTAAVTGLVSMVNSAVPMAITIAVVSIAIMIFRRITMV